MRLTPLSAALAVALTLPAHAEQATPEQVAEVCSMLGDISADTMRARQEGVTLSYAMNHMAASLKEPLLGPLLKEMMLSAWEAPRYSTAANQERAVVDFRNGFEVQCHRSFDK